MGVGRGLGVREDVEVGRGAGGLEVGGGVGVPVTAGRGLGVFTGVAGAEGVGVGMATGVAAGPAPAATIGPGSAEPHAGTNTARQHATTAVFPGRIITGCGSGLNAIATLR